MLSAMSLQDSHIWNLVERFVDESEVGTLGLNVLKLPEHEVASVWNKHKPDANLTARELIQKWLLDLQHENRTEAYTSLSSSLMKNHMSQRAGLLKQWVAGIEQPLSAQST